MGTASPLPNECRNIIIIIIKTVIIIYYIKVSINLSKLRKFAFRLVGI